MTHTIDTAGPWVDVVFIQDTSDEDFDFDNAGVGDIVEYLSNWDYGDETDSAHTLGHAPWGSDYRLYQVGDYVLSANYRLGYYSLNRRPLA